MTQTTTTLRFYLVQMHDGKLTNLHEKEFLEQFPKPAPNFKERLKQIQTFYPDAVDWSLEDYPR